MRGRRSREERKYGKERDIEAGKEEQRWEEGIYKRGKKKEGRERDWR